MANVLIPQSFRDQPRWRKAHSPWLAALEDAVVQICGRWDLRIDGPSLHGSNALVIPVARGGERLVLRMTQPGAAFDAECHALEFWDGRGTVRLLASSGGDGSMLLERLDTSSTLAALPLPGAVVVIGNLMRRLAVPMTADVRADVRSTGDVVASRSARMEAEWHETAGPFSRSLLTDVLSIAENLSRPREDLAVNADLHFDQVLRGVREPWLAVDPLLLRGDIEYDLARILWTRADEMPTGEDIRECLGALVASAGLDHARAVEWVLWRASDYWLWGLLAGFDADPARCSRIIDAVHPLL